MTVTAPTAVPVSLSNLYWIIAVFQILFVGLLLLTILQGTTHRHPVTIAFFVSSWVASWIALLPYLGRVWDNVRSLSPNHANVAPSTNSFKICVVNALALKYLWTVNPGLLSVFSAEILKVLLICRYGKQSTKTRGGPQPRRPAVDLLYTKKTEKSVDYRPLGLCANFNNLLRRLSCSFSKIKRKKLWDVFLVFLPLITSLPAPIITAARLSSAEWKSIYINRFACSAVGRDVEEKLTLLLMWHLVPSSILSLISLITYISLCRQDAGKVNSYFHFGLTLRLGALSILSGFGGVACMVAAFEIGKPARERNPILEMYMIAFPLIASLFFIDTSIIQIWRSWLHPRDPKAFASQQLFHHQSTRLSLLRLVENVEQTEQDSRKLSDFGNPSPSTFTQKSHRQARPSRVNRSLPRRSFSSIFSAYQYHNRVTLPKFPSKAFQPRSAESV